MEIIRQEHGFKENERIARNPCMNCGACCVVYRASFYWSEVDDIREGGVPVHLTERVNNFRIAMRKKTVQDKRCIALHGVPGQNVRCTIYERRPSVCRNFEPSWKAGHDNPLCSRARALLGFDPPSQDFRMGSRVAYQVVLNRPVFRGYRRSFLGGSDLEQCVRYSNSCDE